MLISLFIAILFYVNSIGRKNFKLLKNEVEILDQKILFLFGLEYHLPMIFTPSAPECKTKRTPSAVGNSKVDKLNLVLLKDAVLFSVLKDDLIIQL